MKLIVENGSSGHNKYYPIELLSVVDSDDDLPMDECESKSESRKYHTTNIFGQPKGSHDETNAEFLGMSHIPKNCNGHWPRCFF